VDALLETFEVCLVSSAAKKVRKSPIGGGLRLSN